MGRPSPRPPRKLPRDPGPLPTAHPETRGQCPHGRGWRQEVAEELPVGLEGRPKSSRADGGGGCPLPYTQRTSPGGRASCTVREFQLNKAVRDGGRGRGRVPSAGRRPCPSTVGPRSRRARPQGGTRSSGSDLGPEAQPDQSRVPTHVLGVGGGVSRKPGVPPSERREDTRVGPTAGGEDHLPGSQPVTQSQHPSISDASQRGRRLDRQPRVGPAAECAGRRAKWDQEAPVQRH